MSRHLGRFTTGQVAAWSAWGEEGGALSLGPGGRVRPTDRGLFVAQDLAAELLVS